MDNIDITEDKKPILDIIERNFVGKRLIIVEAPPGAGKTFLSVLCAKKLIEIGNIKSNQKVLLITFSRNARAQINKEADAVFVGDKEKLKQIEITNFHSFFKKYVWAYRSYLSLPFELNLVWPQRRQEQIHSIVSSNISEKISEKTIEALSSCLEFQPNNFIPPHCPIKYHEEVTKIKGFILNLNKNGFIAYEDLAYYFHLLLKKSPFILNTLRSKYPFIILDEYQDSSDFQDLIVRELLGESNKAIVFADDMQMIHSWRGASPDRIKNLRRDFECFSIALYQLPRYKDCPDLKNIFEELRKALKNNNYSKKIDCNTKVFELRETTISKKILNIPNNYNRRKATNSYIAKSDVLNFLLKNVHVDSNIAILLPFNVDVNIYKRIFREKNLPVKEISKGDKQHNFIGLLIENICISSEQEKKIFILKIMCYIDFAKIRDGLSWENRLEEVTNNPSLKISGNKRDIRKALKLDEIVKNSQNFKELLISLHNSIKESKSKLSIDWDIFRILSNIVRKIEATENAEFKKLFTNILLQEQYMKAHKILRGIYVLNVHQSKGKEFDWVILPDVTEDAFPSDNNDKRKLFYVAVTRARKRVIIYERSNLSKILNFFRFSKGYAGG